MKRSITRWTTTLATVTMLGVPALGSAQTTPQQPPAATESAERAQPGDHLAKAQTALAGIEATSVTGKTKTQLTELKKHLNALQKASATPGTSARAGNWATEVAAVDKLLNTMLGTTATGTAGAVGTSGAVATPANLDDATRAKLTEVREHVTQFAAAMSGTASAPASATAAAATSSAAATGSPASTTSAPATTTASPTIAATQPAAQNPATPPAAEQPQQASSQVDTTAARRHITEARDVLSAMTQLPAAATLSGDTRTQVNALIANFNELITNQTDWRGSYVKVEDNLRALLGPEDAMAPATPPAATGTAGAVGTSGTAAATAANAVDPAVREKLIELRSKLNEFERAMGGATVPGATAAAADPATAASTATASTAAPATTEPEADPQARTGASAEAMQHIAAIEAILNGNATATTGTSGTAGTTATPSTPATTSGAPLTLTRTQVEELKTHLNALKKSIEKK